MKSDFRLVITLLCAVSFIFVLRDTNNSPGNFLRRQVKRLLDDNTYINQFCNGINLQTAVSSSDLKASNDVRVSLAKLRHGNPLINFIEGPDSRDQFAKKYVAPALAFGAPWIIFFIITILLCLGFLINWCCMYCKCCGCCKCCGVPQNNKHSAGLGGSAAFFAIATIAVAIAGIVVSRGVSTGGSATLCAGITLVSKLIEGDNSQSWVGVQPLTAKLYDVLSTYDDTMNGLRVAFPLNNAAVAALAGGSLANIPLGLGGVVPTGGAFSTNYTASGTDAAYTAAIGSVEMMYSLYNGKNVSRSDPTYASSSYTPDYISNLGPTSSSNSNTGQIEDEMDDKKTRVKTAATNTDQSMVTLFAAQIAFRDALASGEQTAYNTSVSMSKLYSKIGTFGTDAQSAFVALGGGLLGLFVVEGVLAVFGMLSMCLVWRGAKFFNKGVHISWCCIGLLTLLTWILAAVSLPASLIFFEVCDASNLFINNATFFNQTFDKFLPAEVTDSGTSLIPSSLGSVTGGSTINSALSSATNTSSSDNGSSTNKSITQARNILYNCLFAEQDMLKILNISDTIAIFNNLMEPADTIADLTGNVTTKSVVIPSQMSQVSSYGSGKVVDATVVTTDLNTLNSYTNKNTQSCTSVQDTWVLNSALCTSAMGTVFPAGGADTYNVGSPTCIGFDVWTNQSISNRYTNLNYPSSCSKVGSSDMLTYVQSFVNNFVNDRDTVENLFADLYSSLVSINSNNNALITDILAATISYPVLKNITASWYTDITDPKVGVYDNSKCTFVKSSVQTVHDTMCNAFIVNLFQSAIAIIVISFMSFFGFIMLFCLAKRFISPKPGSKQGAKGNNNRYAY